jgi:hypothetical protein
LIIVPFHHRNIRDPGFNPGLQAGNMALDWFHIERNGEGLSGPIYPCQFKVQKNFWPDKIPILLLLTIWLIYGREE